VTRPRDRKLVRIHRALAVLALETSPAEASKATKAAEEDFRRGRYAEGTAQSRRALWIRERALGPQAPDTAKSRRDLGEALLVEGRYVPAERHLRLALAALERTLGLGHADTSAPLMRPRCG